MAISWQKSKNPNLLTEQLEKLKKIGKDGRATFTGFEFSMFSTLLFNILDFPADISEIDARQIITNSLFTTASKKEISPKNLLFELNRIYQKFLLLPLNRYALVTSISISKFVRFNELHLDNDRIFFDKNLSKKFDTKAREEIIRKSAEYLNYQIPKDYSYVRVFVSSRTKNDAANKALDKINFIRGIWNWVINSSFTFRKTFMGEPNPINKIILGPVHTLHNSKGELLGNDEWWYEPNYLGPIKPYNPDRKNLETLLKSTSYVRKRINGLNYSNDIKTALIRYAIALDDRDMFSAYLKLWGILEFLTATDNYCNLEKRISSIYKETEFHKQVLKILKEFRNSYVHSGEETNEIEAYLIRLKNYVDSIIKFHLTNKFKFESIEKFSEFLDLPENEKEFKYKLKLYSFAKKFRNY